MTEEQRERKRESVRRYQASEKGKAAAKKAANKRERKEYVKEYNKNYTRSEKGVKKYLYFHKLSHSEARGHQAPEFTQEEFNIWLDNNNFKELYDNWVASDYNKDLKPSVDRLDDDVHYRFDNMQLITWHENNTKNHDKMRNTRHLNQYNLKD